MTTDRIKPITPDEVSKRKQEVIPDEVVQVFNELILENWNGHYSEFRFSKAASMVAERLNVTLPVVYEKRWMDIEDIFRKEGWTVEYDQPGYCETYPATFKFSRAKTR